MATHKVSILSGATKPDNQGTCYEQPYDIEATNDLWQPMLFGFDDSSVRVGLYGEFEVPANYNGTPKIIVIWTSAVATGAVVFDFDYRAIGGDDAESLDQATAQESVTVTDTAPGAAQRRMEVQLPALTAGNIAAGDTMEWILFRDGTDAADTMAGRAVIRNILFSYTDIAG